MDLDAEPGKNWHADELACGMSWQCDGPSVTSCWIASQAAKKLRLSETEVRDAATHDKNGMSEDSLRSQNERTDSAGLAAANREPASPAPINHYPVYSPRFWHGMRAGTWFRLLMRNRFKMTLARAHIAVGVSLIAPKNDVLALAQRTIFGRKIAQTNIEHPPIFILGHWRSGTTLLHELMVTNPDHACPNTYQCFAPWHFLLSEPLMVMLGGFLLPQRRPMDNMEAGWLLPQEDEFALMNLGLPTPYLRIACPQTQDKHLDYLTLEGIPEDELKTWRERFTWFLKVLTYHFGGKRLVLKSPTHTGRIAELSRMFPNAKFIHLTREPTQLFTSTIRLWRSLEDVQALQDSLPQTEMEKYVAECHQRMYAQFEESKSELGDRLVDIRYEELVANPFDVVKGLYQQLSLGDFSKVEDGLRERLASHKKYQANKHAIDDELQKHVHSIWSSYAKNYGYEQKHSSNELQDLGASS